MEQSDYGSKSQQIRQLASLPPDKLVDHLSGIHNGLGTVAPNLEPHVHTAAINAIQFLNSKLPNAGNELLQDKHPEPSGTQKRAWLDLHKTVDDPTSVFDHINNHTLNNHHIEALKTVYPDLHQDMVQKIQEHLGEMKTKGQTLSYSKRAVLSKFIGQPIDSTFTPQSSQAIIMSAGQAQTPQTGQGKSQKKASGPELSQINKVNSLYQTQEQARATRERK